MRALILLLYLVSCARAAAPGPVRVDARAELAAALHLLASDTPGFRRSGDPYADELALLVRPFKGHRVAALYRALEARGLRPHELLFLLRARLDEATLRPNGSSEPIAGPVLDEGEVRAFAAAASDFAEEARFASWLGYWRRKTLEPGRARAEARLSELDHLGRLQRYLGLAPRVESELVYTPLFEGRSSEFARSGGRTKSVSFYGEADFVAMSPFIWQELTHATLDHLADAHGRELQALPFTDEETRLCGEKWNCAAEFVARGVALHLFRLTYPGAQPDPGFTIDAPAARVEAALKSFDARRKRYRTIADFYPALIRALRGPRST